MTTLLPDVLRGVQEPRVCNFPPYVTSAGIEAAELAESVGLIPMPWQRTVLTHSLGERADGRWSAPEVGLIVGRQNGKNVGFTEIIELAGLILFGEELILHSAHEFKTAMEAFRRIVARFENYDDLRRRVKKVINANGDEGIELLTGQRLRFVARSKGSGRGFSADRIVLDEAYELTAGQVEALIPTMNARPNPQLVYTSSPPLDGISGEQLMMVRDRGESGQDPELAWFDFGAAGELEDLSGVDLDDRQLWAATNPSYGYLLSEEAIARNRRIMSPAGFAREQLGIWPRRVSTTSMVDLRAWADLANPAARGGAGMACGVDITPGRDAGAITAVGDTPDGVPRLVVLEHGAGIDWMLERIVAINQQHRPVAWVLDDKSPAVSLIEPMTKAGIKLLDRQQKPKRGGLWIPTIGELCAGAGLFADLVRQGGLVHLGQDAMSLAIAGARSRPLGDGSWFWGRKVSDADISPLVAGTEALAAWERFKHLLLRSGPNVW